MNRDLKGRFVLFTIFAVVVLMVLYVSGYSDVIGVYLDQNNSTVSIDAEVNKSDNSGGPVFGVFVENDTQDTLSLTVNATINATATNDSGGSMTLGIFGNGTMEENAQSRPIDLTITENGGISVYASGNGTGQGDGADVLAGGALGNFTNIYNHGAIYVTGVAGNDTTSLMVGGIGGSDVSNFFNLGGIYVNGTGGYVNVTDNIPIGVDFLSVTYFVNNGTISLNVESINATGIGVRSDEFATVENNGNVKVSVNATSGEGAFGAGFYAGSPGIVSEGYPGDIGNFTNNGTIEVKVYGPSGGLALAMGVGAHGNGTVGGNIDKFENGVGGIIDVYATANDAAAYGVYGDGNMTEGINSGVIKAQAKGVISTRAEGVYVDGNIGNFTNEVGGVIIANATATGGDAFAEGVVAGDDITGDFVNRGSITAIANATGGNAFSAGVDAVNIANFTNNGNLTVEASVIGQSTYAYAWAYGVDIWSSIGNFTNSGDITVTATGGYAEAYGIYAGGDIGNFTNNGNITATANATGGYATAHGVSAYYISSFRNTGNITVTATGGNAEAYGMEAWDYIDNFTNSGNMVVSATATGGNARAAGVYVESNIGNFTNTQTITATAESDGDAYAFGVNSGDIGNFTNNRNIIATANAIGQTAYAFGVDASSIGNFTNTGNIIVTANATATYNVGAEAYGVWANQIGNFTNTGTLIVKSIANGTALYENISTSYGIYTSHIDNFFNNGTLDVYAESIFSNPTEDVLISAGGVYVSEIDSVGNFTNEGTIKVTAYANGEVANSVAINVFGADLATLNYFNNTGSLEVYVNSKYQNATINAAALKVTDSSNASLTNNGTMKVVLNLPSNANMTNVNASVFWIENSNATISNYGNTSVESNVAGPNLRTLYVAGTSDVTLRDKFAITFGAPGVNPGTRPIYVGSGSSLNLNNAILVARIDSRNLKYDVKYYLIENHGVVTGQWGGLEKGYVNDQINVYWAGEDMGENSAVKFVYSQPTRSVIDSAMAPAIGGLAQGGIIMTHINNMIDIYAPFGAIGSLLLSDKTDLPIMFAASAVSDAGLPLKVGKDRPGFGMWLMPLYTRVTDGGIGFDADVYGFALGFGGMVTDRFGLDVYGGYVRSNLGYKIKGADSSSIDTAVGGLLMRYELGNNYFVRLLGEVHSSSNDYKGKTGMDFELIEKASYDSWGASGELLFGKVFEFGRVKVVPEVGVGYGYYDTDSFKSKVRDRSGVRVENWERYYRPDSVDVWKFIGAVNGVVKLTDRVKVYGTLRLEQAISDNDISVVNWINWDPTRHKLTKSIGDTNIMVDVGVGIDIVKNLKLTFGGRADFNSDYSAYTGRVQLRYTF